MFGSPISVEWLLWGAAGLVAAWVYLPILLMMLGLARVGFRIVGGPETLEPHGDDPQYADLFDHLRELGFEPLGSRQEIGRFCNQHWYKVYPTGRVFALPRRDGFATLYRIFAGQPWRLSFHTIFTDGSLVSTANQMPELRIDREGYFRWGHVTRDLAELLRMHREAADDYRAERGLTVATHDMEGICATICRHSQRYLQNQGPAMGLKALGTPFVFAALFAFVVGSECGFDHWAVPAAVILAGAAYRLLLPLSVREAARQGWQEDQQRGLADQWARRRQDIRFAPRGETSDAVTLPDPRPRDDDRITH